MRGLGTSHRANTHPGPLTDTTLTCDTSTFAPMQNNLIWAIVGILLIVVLILALTGNLAT